MRHLIFSISVFCLLKAGAASAQASADGLAQKFTQKETSRRNTAYLELGGIAAYYSFNYQRNIPLAKNFELGLGAALAPVYTLSLEMDNAEWSPRLALQAQAVYKLGRHEIGAGPAVCWYTYREGSGSESHYMTPQTAIFGQLGYGYTTTAGLYLGAYFTPMVFDVGMAEFMPWGGLRLGYRF